MKKVGLFIPLFFVFVLSLYSFWLFSNHSQKASIEQVSKKIVMTCKNDRSWENCYAINIANWVKKNDTQKFYPLLQNIQQLDTKTNDCHLITHQLGQELYDNTNDLFTIFKYVPADVCGGGFIHGIIEKEQQKDKSIIFSPSTLDTLCIRIMQKSPTKYTYDACYHGIGHVVYVEKNANINDSLAFCQNFPRDKRYDCFTGVFMESIVQYGIKTHGLPQYELDNVESVHQRISLCNSFTDDIKIPCWRELAHLLVPYTHYNVVETYQFCDTAPSYKTKKECILHASELMITSHPSITSSSVSTLCSPFKKSNNDLLACIDATVHAAISASLRNEKKVEAMCNAQKGTYKDFCFRKWALYRNSTESQTDDISN